MTKEIKIKAPAFGTGLADIVKLIQSNWPENTFKIKIGTEVNHEGNFFIVVPDIDGIQKCEIGMTIGLNWENHFRKHLLCVE